MAQSNHDGTWTLSQAEYQELKNRSEWLRCLEEAGVDSWSGIERAIELRED